MKKPSKKAASASASTPATRDLSVAFARGRDLAAAILTQRAQRRRRTQRRVRSAGQPSAGPVSFGAPAAGPVPVAAAGAGAGAADVVIAEGDSWFDYPFHDVLGMLEDEYGYDVESVAHKGDTLEDMAHSGGQFEELARRLEKLLRQGRTPCAILISGGGNDIAGDEFAQLLNHAASGLPALNEDVVRGIIDVRLRTALGAIIGGLTEITRAHLGRAIPIVVHGYAYPVPDGRGYLGGWWVLPGPWLEPGFRRKGHLDRVANTQTVGTLIDRFNEMLAQLVRHPEFAHVRHLDLRRTLRRDESYRQDWENELHPTEAGFQRVTAQFAAAISAVRG